jgi:WD40 repeat protein
LTDQFCSIYGVALSADGRTAAFASGDATITVWEVDTGREIRTLEGHSRPVHGVALGADGRTAVSASEDMTLKMWDVASGRGIAEFACDAMAQCCAFIGNTVVAGDAVGGVHILKLVE